MSPPRLDVEVVEERAPARAGHISAPVFRGRIAHRGAHRAGLVPEREPCRRGSPGCLPATGSSQPFVHPANRSVRGTGVAPAV